MGLVQAVVGAVGGVLGDQWKDFYTVPQGLPATAALFAAVPQGTNAGRGSNTSGSTNIITNGSKIIVPEGYGLLLMQDGAITVNAKGEREIMDDKARASELKRVEDIIRSDCGPLPADVGGATKP